MSEAGGGHRRQPPSPLVFAPDTVLSPIPLQAQSSTTSSHGSGSNTVSMPFVRRHVTRRLKAAKAECDKELQRVTGNVTAYFEERLRETDHEFERDHRERGQDRDSQIGDHEHLREPFAFHSGELGGGHLDDYSSDGGYEAEIEYNRHSRQRGYHDGEPHRPRSSLSHSRSTSGLSIASVQMSPGSLKRHSAAPWDKPMSSSVSSSVLGSSPASSTIMLPETSITRKPSVTSPAPTSWSSSGASSRRLSRGIHIPPRPSASGQSSRSTSRSRSPLPPTSSHASFSDYASSTFNRRSSRLFVDEPVDPIMTALYDLTAVATDVTDTSVTQLMSNPKISESVVQRVQNIGKAWDDHPDWPGRNWYVQVLLAVASLSRVVEWWEAEKQFWNFDDNNDEQDEPLMFVMKPADEEGQKDMELELDEFRLDDKPPSPRISRNPKEEEEEFPLTSTEDEGALTTPSRSTPSKGITSAESARVLATERLKLQAETAQNQNIVMELSLDGDHFIWVNHAWRVVIGSDPESLSGTRISSLLAPTDWGVFKEATNRLQEDDSHTVEVRFKVQIEPTVQREPSDGMLYQLMEGKGMLMIDREDGQPSHTMWVVRPIAPARFENDAISINLESDDLAPEPASTIKQSFIDRTLTEPPTPFPFSEPIVTDTILCRICESQIPQWYFEKHSETCVESHRLEAEVMECNESISELRNTIRDLTSAIDRSSPAAAPEYRGMPVFIPSSQTLSSPLQLFRANKLQRFSVKKMQKRFLEQVDDILQTCLEISMPSLKEEEAEEPIERQRLLSPTSERKMSSIRNWAKPTTEDAALSQLLQDAERVMRQKIDSVVRMQNTMRYAEKIWTEWKELIDNHLATINESESESGSSVGDATSEANKEPPESSIDDNSSTRSEYNYGRDQSRKRLSPSPISCLSPIPFITSPTEIRNVGSPLSPPSNYNHSVPLAMPQSSVITFGPRQQQLTTRSNTPSSVSSPLARAPIVASTSPEEPGPPPVSITDSAANLTIRTRKSNQSLMEPKFVVTPPASPQVLAGDPSSGPGLTREGSTTRRGNRRHSNANALTSPPVTGPLSPRQMSGIPLPRATPTSIKDFDIIKPISKGAFGSVFLAKKKATGDYYAIKVLKKADMIAKNQITNVKAERMILMKQAESPFVAKLYFTFQSKDNLYLVMEYLNGGDCAALIKSLGCLSEEWTKNYIAEVVLGLEYLHQRGIVHRDLKPDNLLIDQHGHLKLTDFGLSRIGLLGRQTRDTQFGRALGRYGSRSRPPSMDSAYFSSPLVFNDPSGGSYFTQRPASVSRAANNSPYLPPADDVGESSGSESLANFHARRGAKMTDSPLQSFATELTTDLRSHSNSNASGSTPPGEQKFVGTPDYLAPETILGLRGDDAAVDWWALGVITYEFLYGLPPFNAETPEKVFENILSGQIEWHEEWVEYSPEARDFMQALMNVDPNERLGSRGADEVKAHSWFDGIEWDNITSSPAKFIPQVDDPESTDYFDPRGAIPQLFHDDDDMVAVTSRTDSPANVPFAPTAPVAIAGKDVPNSAGSDDFGSFSFKNLPVLKQANDDVIRKLKTDQMAPITHTLAEPVNYQHQRRRSVSQRIKKPPSVVTNMDPKLMSTNPPSPATSTSSIASSPSRTSLPPPTPGMGGAHSRKPSEFGAIERFKYNHLDGDRRNSMPSRLRTASVSSAGDGSGSDTWNSSIGNGSQHENTPASSVHSIDLRKNPDPSDRIVTCLLAEDNPITAKIIETILVRLGCRCVVVSDGSEAISVAMGDIKFDCILMDLQMPVLDGEGAARYIKSTNGKNTNTPIVSVSAYSGMDPSENSNVFDAALSKPLQKADLLNVFRQLGFKTTAMHGSSNPKVVNSTHLGQTVIAAA
ncbi:kinase-like protein [Coprinopsis marcescibilis]|uniref:non-specific serine/threonine protein kinase n=1 Tax=Coprinopsis marcescibilis TaxID=230819 RepID=A0A5C3L892_COPMA|nr:kinase-like protein [Coprinopsis marcescibilis]